MKLFQIEEPDGSLGAPEGPGVAVGIDLDPAGCAVAVAVGGNAEILPDADGALRLAAPGPLTNAHALRAVLLALRGSAEKQLVRPVTHAVIAAAALDPPAERAIAAAAEAAGLSVLRLVTRAAAAASAAGAQATDAAVLGAAVLAENLAPIPPSGS